MIFNDPFSKYFEVEFKQAIMRIITQTESLQGMSKIAANAVDGSGVEKVIQKLLGGNALCE